MSRWGLSTPFAGTSACKHSTSTHRDGWAAEAVATISLEYSGASTDVSGWLVSFLEERVVLHLPSLGGMLVWPSRKVSRTECG